MNSFVIYEPTFRPVQTNLYNENGRTPKQYLCQDDLHPNFPELYRDEPLEREKPGSVMHLCESGPVLNVGCPSGG